MRYVLLADKRPAALGRYVAAWKRCLELPAETHIGRGISGWGETAGEALRELRRGMDDRINRHIPGYGVGRKWDADYQRAMSQAAHAVNTPRLVIRWLPADLMKISRLRERVEYGRSI